jgi:hypothetical protein
MWAMLLLLLLLLLVLLSLTPVARQLLIRHVRICLCHHVL